MRVFLIIGGICSIFLLANRVYSENKQLPFVTFPSVSNSISPDGNYVLRNEDLKNENLDHNLYLKNLTTNQEELLYTYGRSLGVLWSPFGNGLIINDYATSDETWPVIFLFKKKTKIVLDYKELKKELGDINSIFKNDHVYTEGIEWLTQDRIKIRIKGHGDVDPNGFTIFYVYTIGDGFQFIKRLETEEENER